ncbi:MAG: hypothetical protein ABDH20_01500 [Thermus sp.]
MKVKEIPEEAVLVQDSQDRLALLEAVGKRELMDEYPTLFALVGDGEILRVWGCRSFVPYLKAPVEEVYP